MCIYMCVYAEGVSVYESGCKTEWSILSSEAGPPHSTSVTWCWNCTLAYGGFTMNLKLWNGIRDSIWMCLFVWWCVVI